MKHSFLILLLFFCVACKEKDRGVEHVVLISIDGSRPEFCQDSSWHAPHLQRLQEEGVYAAEGIQSVFPSVTYPSHTAIVTGAYPVHSGIYYNVPFGAKKRHWYWDESAIQTKTLWDAVKEAGMTSAAIMWPVTVGAPIDYNFPVRRPEQGEEGDQLSVTRRYVSPRSLLDDFEKATGGQLTSADYSDHFMIDRSTGKLAAYIIETYKPNLTAIHFVCVDHMEHVSGRNSRLTHRAVALADSLVGAVLQSIERAGIKSNTAVIVTGDHGMADVSASFSPNVYLRKNGLITPDGWKALFHASGGSAFLYLKDKNDTATLDKVKTILGALPAAQQQLFRVTDREELDSMGANPEVALALAMKEGVAATDRREGDPFIPREANRGNHGYDPAMQAMHTEFIAVGAGIGPHRNITGMGIKDVAPVVARLLGLPFKAPDGVLIPGILNK